MIPTWQAYNDWGGYSLYVGNSTGSPWCCSSLDPGRAVEVSYNRPFASRFDTTGGQDFFFSMEFPMIEWMEENGYNVNYVSSAGVRRGHQRPDAQPAQDVHDRWAFGVLVGRNAHCRD